VPFDQPKVVEFASPRNDGVKRLVASLMMKAAEAFPPVGLLHQIERDAFFGSAHHFLEHLRGHVLPLHGFIRGAEAAGSEKESQNTSSNKQCVSHGESLAQS
jgi:hypothetical protein